MNIPFEGRITQSDILTVYSFSMRGKRWMNYVMLPFFILAIVAVFLSLMRQTFDLWPVLFILTYGISLRLPDTDPVSKSREAYRSSPEMRGTFRGSVSEDGLTIQTANVATDFKWTAFRKVDRKSDLVLLFVNDDNFNFFPRSFFASDADWQAFQALVDQKIKDGTLLVRTIKREKRYILTAIGLVFLAVLLILILTLMFFNPLGR